MEIGMPFQCGTSMKSLVRHKSVKFPDIFQFFVCYRDARRSPFLNPEPCRFAPGTLTLGNNTYVFRDAAFMGMSVPRNPISMIVPPVAVVCASTTKPLPTTGPRTRRAPLPPGCRPRCEPSSHFLRVYLPKNPAVQIRRIVPPDLNHQDRTTSSPFDGRRSGDDHRMGGVQWCRPPDHHEENQRRCFMPRPA